MKGYLVDTNVPSELTRETPDARVVAFLRLTASFCRGRVDLEVFFDREAPLTLEIARPETEARIQRHLESGQFHDLDDLLTKALDALPAPEAATPPERRSGQALIDAFAEIRGLLSDEEIDRMFSRNPSVARRV